ncbi:hypothetical protein LUW74_08185 [Actinomadura madurae]|nr:hypothetical protein [Actinomadura madurae]URN03327.1 hypothetical protein LUW74_08185 [Actinomadura madurae]
MLLYEAVQVPGRADLGTQHGREPLGGQQVRGSVVHDAGGMHHGGHRMFRRHQREGAGEAVSVGGVAGGERHVHVQSGQFGRQFPGLRGTFPGTAQQQQSADAVHAGEVPGDQAAEGAGGAGDQRRPGPRHRRAALVGAARGRGARGCQRGDQAPPVSEGELWLPRSRGRA